MSAWRSGFDAGTETVPRQMVVTVAAADLGGNGDGDGNITVPATLSPDPAKAAGDLVQKAADVWTKWIPGDVLAVYLALTTAYRGTLGADEQGEFTPHGWGILVAGLCLAAGLSVLGAWSANLKESDREKRVRATEFVGRAVLATAAFAFWSVGVPGSWWEVKQWDAGVRAAVVFAISIVFAFVAEIIAAYLKPGRA